MILAIDTVFSACSVALSDATGTLVAAQHLEQARGQAETLVPMVEGVLQSAGATPKDITHIVVTTGPGTFAGVRIGIAFARTLVLTTGAAVMGISSFEALAGAVVLDGKNAKDQSILAVMPGKRGEVSAALFEALGGETFPPKTLKAPENMPIEALVAWVGVKMGVVIGPKAGDLEGLDGYDVKTRWITAKDLIRIAALFPKSAYQATVSPFYLRTPDATPQKSPFSNA